MVCLPEILNWNLNPITSVQCLQIYPPIEDMHVLPCLRILLVSSSGFFVGFVIHGLRCRLGKGSLLKSGGFGSPGKKPTDTDAGSVSLVRHHL